MGILITPETNLTTAQRDSISGDELRAGIIIFNTDTNKFQGYNGSAWVNAAEGGGGGSVTEDTVIALAIALG